MRLGELLLQRGAITREQLQRALHEQGRFGGRLGTNLLRLRCVDVDTVALALADQHNLFAVLRQHVAAVDRKVLSIFSPKVVALYKAIPIGYTTTKPTRVIVACVDPASIPMEELAFAAGSRIELWIAPEALFQDCMERYFGAKPARNRYVSLKPEAHESISAVRIPTGVQPEVAQAPPAAAPQPKPAKTSKRNVARELSPPPPPPPTAVPFTLEAPPPPPPPQPPPSADDQLPDEDDWNSAPAPPEAPVEARPITAPPDALRPVLDRAQASTLLEMATSKEQIGEVLADWLRSTFGCGLVLLLKADMAMGWKGFFPDADDLVEAVAIPLGKPTMFSLAYESRAPYRGAPPPEGAKLQERLWKLLRCSPPAEVLVCPIVLGKRAVNLIYAHMEDGSPLPDSAVEDATTLCAEAAAAYARLIDRKKR
jgi:hypothetical protein